ncbi:MAG: N-acetyl-gamma-glutamyl-phosphate reductase [Chloroflexi bacterium]|nr:N-acetyl-gamma-glutamyl-phosphate reductase [Chloroflexota bacterium]
MVVKAGIFGATGYTGVELIKLLQRHKGARLVFAASESSAGQRLCDVIPCAFETALVKPDDAPLQEADVVFSCLPHGVSGQMCARVLGAGKRAVDFSADFRLRDPAAYARWYKQEHPCPELLQEAVYGLPEIYRGVLPDANLVANPGCYPTSVILGALPVLELGALADPVVIADSKSGVSGAGRKLTQSTHFVEVNENLAPYNVGHAHRHVPEIEQLLNDAWVGREKRLEIGDSESPISNLESPISVLFSPHLLPISRGMLSALYFRLTPEAAGQDWHAIFARRYDGEPFVRVLPQGQIATIAHVAHNNLCVLSVHQQSGSLGDRLMVVVCIDNLVKGASGQALQSMNLMFGLDEAEGLG